MSKNGTKDISTICDDPIFISYTSCLSAPTTLQIDNLRIELINKYGKSELGKALLHHLDGVCKCYCSEDCKTIQEDDDSDPIKIIIKELLEKLDVTDDEVSNITDTMLNEIKFSIKT